MSEAAATGRLRTGSLTGALTVAAYAVLGSILLWTRLAGLDRSFWLDELWTVDDYVRGGPRDILAGPYLPNNHELFSMLGWVTSSIVGESEIALRLWSVLPFLVAVALVTAWLHVRLGALSGVLYLFLATGSPLLLDITRQARGYGLAFLAMSVVVVAALEADRTGRTRWIALVFVGGVVGTLTLVNFGIAFVATAAVLLSDRALRRRVAVGLIASLLVAIAWYAPHLGDLTESSRQVYGVRIGLLGVVTAPIDQILVPALLWYDGVVVFAGLLWLPIIAVALVFIGSSPLLGWNRTSAILSAGVVVTVVAIWIARVYAVPRFLSFLLVPLFMLVASGAASILARLASRPPLVRTLLALSTVVVLVFVFTPAALEVARLPREANKDAAQVIRAEAPPSARVYPYMVHPRTLAYYLDTPLERRPTQDDVPQLCSNVEPFVLVEQPWVLPPLRVPCLARPGVQHYRFEQYARGDEINVWLVPPQR